MIKGDGWFRRRKSGRVLESLCFLCTTANPSLEERKLSVAEDSIL